jgi:thiol-disulfide isomerase/thioredoxin
LLPLGGTKLPAHLRYRQNSISAIGFFAIFRFILDFAQIYTEKRGENTGFLAPFVKIFAHSVVQFDTNPGVRSARQPPLFPTFALCVTIGVYFHPHNRSFCMSSRPVSSLFLPSFFLGAPLLCISVLFMPALLIITLLTVASVQAQDEPARTISLNDAKTFADVMDYLNNEVRKHDLAALEPKKRASLLAGIVLPASEKMMEFAQEPHEKRMAANMKFSALINQVRAEMEGAEQKVEAFLKEAATRPETSGVIEQWQGYFLIMLTDIKGIKVTESKLEAFLKELAAKEKTEPRAAMILELRFFLFSEKAKKVETPPQNFDQFKAELKTWIGKENVPMSEIAALGFLIAHQNKVPAEQIAKELTAYIQSPQCTVPAEGKKGLIEVLEKGLKFAIGVNPKLYGKTLDGKDFDWQSLRGKHVLIKFTATWCGPCQAQIPDMIKAYEQYRSKGLEIVSVYIWQDAPGIGVPDPVATVKNYVEEHKIPWIILSETLAERAGQPRYSDFYLIEGVPALVLVDKEGKILVGGGEWRDKLTEIFK